MHFEDHSDRPGWKVGEEVESIENPPPASPLDGMRCLYGMAPGDWEYCLYLVPASTHIEEIVEFFEVGTRGALVHGWSERETMDLVTEQLSLVDSVVPGTIEVADPGSLRIRFDKRLTQSELEQIEEIYRKVDMFQAGLEGYLNGTTGGSLLDDMAEAGFLKLWWS